MGRDLARGKGQLHERAKSNGDRGGVSGVQAVVDWCGPADFPLFLKTLTPGARKPVEGLLGGAGDAVKDIAVKASPVTYATRNAPPFLIVHGDKDNVVPIGQGESLRDALKAAGADVTFHVVKGGSHWLNNPQTMQMAIDFFDTHLREKATSRPASRASKTE
jgi:acetyl esterase/lipase